MDAKSLGPIIRTRRVAAGFTQEELGRRAGLSKGIVGQIEREQRTPDREQIVRLSHALGMPPGDLVTLWYRNFLNDINALNTLRDAQAHQPQEDSGSRIDQLIDQIAGLAKDLYRESRNDFREIFQDWLAKPGPSGPHPPSPPRRRVSRKRGPTKG